MAVFEEVDLFLTVVLTAEMMLKTTDGNENEKFFDAGYRFFLRRTGTAGMGVFGNFVRSYGYGSDLRWTGLQ